MECRIYTGIAGWSYKDWDKIVYPDNKTDKLEYVSRFVDCIEINSTFYRPPDNKISSSWLDKVSSKPNFFFTAKLHRDFTHKGKIEPSMVTQFHKGFEPMLEKGKLKKLLVQFRYDFDYKDDNRRHLAKIISYFSDSFDLAVEVRHKSWEKPDALKFLEQSTVTVCNLDYPVIWNSFNLKLCKIGKNGYFRMHGRNKDKWFSKEAGRDETYDYYYNETELAQIKDRIEELSKAYEFLVVIANNHYRGAELANSIELKCLLTGQKQHAPEGLLKAYPKLSSAAEQL